MFDNREKKLKNWPFFGPGGHNFDLRPISPKNKSPATIILRSAIIFPRDFFNVTAVFRTKNNRSRRFILVKLAT